MDTGYFIASARMSQLLGYDEDRWMSKGFHVNVHFYVRAYNLICVLQSILDRTLPTVISIGQIKVIFSVLETEIKEAGRQAILNTPLINFLCGPGNRD